MGGSVTTLSQYRLSRAKEDFKTACDNMKEGSLRASINRSYYAIFHALRAITALDNFDSSKHSGVIKVGHLIAHPSSVFKGELS